MDREDDNYCFILEAGTAWTTLALGKILEHGCAEIQNLVRIESVGIAKSQITDMKQVQYTIAGAVKKLGDLTDWDIGSAVMVVSGAHVAKRTEALRLPIENGVVSEADVDELANSAEEAADADKTRKNLYHEEIGYSVDNVPCNDPVGMTGKTLTRETLYVDADAARTADAENAARKAGLEIAEFLPAGIAAALGCSTEEERRAGTLFIDIGEGTVNWTLFAGGKVIAAAALGVGGAHVTNDIAKAFSCPRPCAAYLKMEASATIALDGAPPRVALPEALSARRGATISRVALNTVVNARLGEVFSIARQTLEREGVYHLVQRGVVLTGGGAMQKNICELAENILGYRARLGTIAPEITFAKACRDAMPAFPGELATIAGAFAMLARNADEAAQGDEAAGESIGRRFFNFVKGGFRK